MLNLTKAQREALKRLFGRCPTYGSNNQAEHPSGAPEPPNTYRQFRTTIKPMFGGGGAVMLPWCNMWLGIEPDGYIHS